MPIDSHIALQVKPPVIPALDVNATFRTLGQLRYLSANTQKVQEEAARAQQIFEGAEAAEGYLSALGRAPVAPGTPAGPPVGGPPFAEAALTPLQAGESTPAPTPGTPGTPPARRPNVFDADVQAEIRRLHPHGAELMIDANQKLHIDQQEREQKIYEHAARGLHGVTDQASLDAWRLAYGPTLPPEVAARIPTTWTPELVPTMLKRAQSLDTTYKQHIEAGKLANETLNAGSQRLTAQTGQQTVELQGREYLAIQTEDGYKLVPKYAGSDGGAGSAPPVVDVPDSGRPRTGEETKAAGAFLQASRSQARLATLEEEIATFGTNPTTDPPRDASGHMIGPGRGTGLLGIVPSLTEDALAHGAGILTGTVGGVVGGVVGAVGGSKVGGPGGGYVGGNAGIQAGQHVGEAVGNTVGANLGNKALDVRRQAYYGEQRNFLETVRGTEPLAEAARRYFPQPGDSEAEVLRKRSVREDALQDLATRTNRRQGSVPVGQKRVGETSGPGQPAPASPSPAPAPLSARSPYADIPTHQLTPAQSEAEIAWHHQRTTARPAAPTFTMDDVRKTAQATGRSVDEVLADASRRQIVIR